MTKLKSVKVYMSEEEVEILRRLAREYGYESLSSFLRDLIRLGLERKVVEG